MPNGPTLRSRSTTVSYKETATYNKTAAGNSSINKSKNAPAPSKSAASTLKKSSPTASTALNSLSSRSSLTTVRTSLSTHSNTSKPTPTGTKNSLLDKIICIESRLKQIEEGSVQQTRLAAIEAVFAQLKTENSDLQLTIEQLKSDLERVQHALLFLSDLEDKYKTAEDSCTRLSADNEILKKRIGELSLESSTLKLEVSSLKSEIHKLNNKQNLQAESSTLLNQGISEEQQELNSNIVIRGVDLTNTTSDLESNRVYESIRAHLGIENDEAFNPESVKVIPSSIAKPTTAKTIQVRFRSVIAKRQFLQIRRTKKDILPTDLGIVQNSKKAILITEQLTRDNQQLLYAARSLRSSHKFKFVWSNNGQILVRPQQNSNVIRISDISQVNELRSNLGLSPFVFPKNGRLPASLNLESLENNSLS